MSKSKIQFNHNIKKIKRQQQEERERIKERIYNSFTFPNFGKVNNY